jgi:tetratricopeptide (TPR) repeat protein
MKACDPTSAISLRRAAFCGVVLAIAFVVAGCGAKKKEISTLNRNQAATFVSEAQFAISVRDHARAEGLLTKATELCPDTGEYWMALGQTRIRLNQREGAKTAYKRALEAFQDNAKTKKSEPQPVFQQVMVLALLGRVDEARALQEKLLTLFPDNRAARNYIEGKVLDRMLADPKFKELAL